MSDRHRWTPEHDASLLVAVEAMLPIRERLGGRMAFWAAVVGASRLDLSPDGARSRWERLGRERRKREAAAVRILDVAPVEDGWSRAARRVEEYEATVGEATLETVTELGARVAQLQRSVTRQERLLVALCTAWSVPLPGETDP